MRFAISLAALAILLGGCTDPRHPLRDPDEFDATTMPPSGCGSDENWRTFDDYETTNRVIVDDAQAAYFLPPLATGANFPSAMKPTFQYQPSKSIAGKPQGDATCSECPTCGPLLPDHLPPVSGDVYDLQLSVGGSTVWRVIHTSQTWTPPDALWNSWRGQSVTLTAFRMGVFQNEQREGPFKSSAPIVFTVGP